jgi:hypothetical protein
VLFLFMEPTSPKGNDITRRGFYALHCNVADAQGTGGEFHLRGHGEQVADLQLRAVATRAASYPPNERYVLFALRVAEARCNGYGDVALPEPRSWRAAAGSM